jgi:kinetochore protein Mis13/DSN1
MFDEPHNTPIILPDFDLLDADERPIRASLADETISSATLRESTTQRLKAVQSSLEFQVDQLADNVHKLEMRVAVAGREANEVLRRSAGRLREREEREKMRTRTKEMPLMEVLRSLSNILPEGG